MAESDVTRILLAHNHWATRNILDACAKLTEAQFHQRFEMGMGSLHDNLVHTQLALQVWTDVLVGRPLGPRPTTLPRFTVPQLLEKLDATSAELLEVAFKHPPGQIVSRVRDGKGEQYTRGAVLAHVATHGMHHRAQCLNMLRHLGVNPLPESSVTSWTRIVDPIMS